VFLHNDLPIFLYILFFVSLVFVSDVANIDRQTAFFWLLLTQKNGAVVAYCS